MNNTILYAADLGIFEPMLMHSVSELAAKQNAKVTVLHCIEPIGIFADAVISSYLSEELKNELRTHGVERVFEEIKDKVLCVLEDELEDEDIDTNLLQDVRVVSGPVAETILFEAEQIDADLIVLGSHSHVSSMPSSLGSVAQKVLQTSHKPVLLVPTLNS